MRKETKGKGACDCAEIRAKEIELVRKIELSICKDLNKCNQYKNSIGKYKVDSEFEKFH